MLALEVELRGFALFFFFFRFFRLRLEGAGWWSLARRRWVTLARSAPGTKAAGPSWSRWKKS